MHEGHVTVRSFVRSIVRSFGCSFVCLVVCYAGVCYARFIQFALTSFYAVAHTRIVNIMKVYIERKNM